MADEIVERSVEEVGSLTDMVGWVQMNFGYRSAASALHDAAFMLCIDVLAQDIAKADLQLRRVLPNGTTKLVMPGEHPLAEFLADEPNDRHTWYDFKEMSVNWLALTKNSFALVNRRRDGEIENLIPLMSSRVNSSATGDAVFYDVTAGTWQEAALLGFYYRRVPERDVIHVRQRMFDGFQGLSTLIVGQQTLDTSGAIDQYRQHIFENDGAIRGVFTREREGAMNEIAFARMKSQFRTLMNRFAENVEPIVLEDGLKFESISTKASDLELTKQFEAQVNAVCRLLRVPPHKVFLMAGIKYENLETIEKSYFTDTLLPICRTFEGRYKKSLLTSRAERASFVFEFDREAMLVRDGKIRQEETKMLAGLGLIETGEARARHNLSPYGDDRDQQRLIPVNMSLIDKDNEVVLKPAASQAADPAADPNPDDPAAEPPEDGDAQKHLRLVK